MRRAFAILVLLSFTAVLSGCRSVSRATASRIRDQHALFKVYIDRKDDGDKKNDPTPAQDDKMVRATLKALEALDREVNGWGRK